MSNNEKLNNPYLVVISDVHATSKTLGRDIKTIQEFLNKYTMQNKQLKALLIGGDFFDQAPKDANEAKFFLNSLRKVVDSSTPIIFSCGNHEIMRLDDNHKWGNCESTSIGYLQNACNDSGITFLDGNKIYQQSEFNLTVDSVALPFFYYEGKRHKEDKEILLNKLIQKKETLSKLKSGDFNTRGSDGLNILLIHSPVYIFDEDIMDIIISKGFNLVVCGHMHRGLVPSPLDRIIDMLPPLKGTGFISPVKNPFPNHTRGTYTHICNDNGKRVIVSINDGFRCLPYCCLRPFYPPKCTIIPLQPDSPKILSLKMGR